MPHPYDLLHRNCEPSGLLILSTMIMASQNFKGPHCSRDKETRPAPDAPAISPSNKNVN